jgi:hypothetical protein
MSWEVESCLGVWETFDYSIASSVKLQVNAISLLSQEKLEFQRIQSSQNVNRRRNFRAV